MRPIDADAFQRDIARMCVKRCHLYENDDDFPNCRECVVNFIYEMLKKAPTIKAKPVVSAHWTEENTDCWHCSDCLHPVLLNGAEEYVFSNYCPFCGAQMDKEELPDE